MSRPPTLSKAIVIFVSSAQDEFKQFRHDLRDTVNTEAWAGWGIAKAILIEDESGGVIPSLIRRYLDESSIYVGIFGKQLRKWVKAEYDYAKSRGLPLLIYRYGKKRESDLDEFLEQVKITGVNVHPTFTNLDKLQTQIMNDLADTIAQMVLENADIRRRINESIPMA